MFKALDGFFCRLEGKKAHSKQKKVNTEAQPENGLGSILYQMFVAGKEPQGVNGLEGWKDDKEKFKIDLINDIKTFLFTKWEKPWKPGLIFNAKGELISGFRSIHGRVYKDKANIMSLDYKKGESPFFITMDALDAQNGKIIDKSKKLYILGSIPIPDEADPNKIKFRVPRFFNVINVDFVTGIKKPKFKTVEFQGFELNEYVENFIKELVKRKRVPKLHYDQSDRCFYTHSLLNHNDESIHLAPIKQFKNLEGYYSTLFHEIVHSTQNPNRLGRGKSLNYANEELVAEMGAMILCSEMGLNYNRQNSLSYLNGWLKKAGDVDTALIEAYAYACDAAEYLMSDIDFDKLVPQSMIDREKEIESDKQEVEAPKKTIYKLNLFAHGLKGKNPVFVYKLEDTEKYYIIGGQFDPIRTVRTTNIESDSDNLTLFGYTLLEDFKGLDLEYIDKPKFKIGDKVSFSISKEKYTGTVKDFHFEESELFGVKTKGFIYHLVEHKNQAFNESELTLTEAASPSLFDTKEKEPGKLAFLPETSPKELDYELAYRAHTGTSFSPEKRAVGHQNDFAKTLNDYAAELEAMVKTDAQKELLITEFARFKDGYKKHYTAWLGAKSNCISTMITGGSKFPVKRAEKANATEHRRSVELSDFESKAIKAIKRKLLNARTDEVKDVEAWARVKDTVSKDIAAIVGIATGKMPGYNKAAFVNSLKGFLLRLHKNGQFEHFSKALELAKEAQDKYKIVIFAPNNEVWRVVSTPTPTKEVKNIENETVYKTDGCEVVNSYIDTRVRLFFDGKPKAEVISDLKKNAFKWSPSNKAWQRQNTPVGLRVAIDLAKRHFPTAPQPTDDDKKEVLKHHKETKANTATTHTATATPTKATAKSPVDVVNIAVSEIFTDEKRFQNRKNSFSEESKNRIIKAIETGSFDWAKFDPIVIWKDSKDGKYYVLSGHSRRAAFVEVSKTDKKYKNIPCKIFKGTEAAAIDLALNSNTLSTKETDIERAGYYHRKLKTALKLGDKERSAAIKAIAAECYDNEGKNAAFILNLGHLNPDGWLVEQMVNLGANRDNENTNTMRTIANWIGEARRIFTSITDMQETEVAKWLLSDGYGTKKGQFRSKVEFMERLRVAVKKWETAGAKANDLLNIAGAVTVSTIESEYNKRLSEVKAEFDKAEKEHREAHDKYLLAVFDGKINQTRFDELMKPSIAYVRKCKEAYDRVKGQSGAMREAEKAQLALFGVENQGKSKRRKAATMRPTVAPHCGNGVREPLQKKPMRLPCKKSFDLTKVVPLSLQGFQPLGSIHASKAKTLALPGEIGKFLGRYERQCYSIVLRGDKGAGKSRLLFQILNAFASKGLKIGFLSLEMNLNSSLFAGYRDQYINKKNIGKIQTSETSLTYDELNDICKQFDVIAVDSWTKLKGLNQSDFDRLQKENPQTIILAIFQSTTGNVTRGGNMPEFDASIVIHVHEGGRAECEKNRYSATDLRYNVFEQKIINEQPEVVK